MSLSHSNNFFQNQNFLKPHFHYPMLNSFICGTFHPEQEECCSEPRKSRKRDSKNPYANRGLDKFSALLADLDQKRQKIYSQVSPREISLVRFVFPNSNDCVPVIVKVKNKKQEHKTQNPVDNSKWTDKFRVTMLAPEQEARKTKLKSKKRSFRWRRSSYYLPAVVMLIMLFMAVFGRSAAVLLTSVMWYLVPRLSGKKKEYVRILSEGISPIGAVKVMSPRHF